MSVIIIRATVGEDRQLTIALSEDFPLGPVEVTVESVPEAPAVVPEAEFARDQARAILAAAGMPSIGPYVPPGTARLTEEE